MKKGITIISGNIFTSEAQTLINPVNTVGIMGAGLALEFRLRYPDMFKKYVELCKSNQISIGKLWLYKTSNKWILNFPTKVDWKNDSKIEYLELGLNEFIHTYKHFEISSAAFPILGSNLGNIPEQKSIDIMLKYLSKCDIPIEIYRYNPKAKDDLYQIFKEKFLSMSLEQIKKKTKIQKHYAEKLLKILSKDEIQSLGQLVSINGIGIKTIEKVFNYVIHNK